MIIYYSSGQLPLVVLNQFCRVVALHTMARSGREIRLKRSEALDRSNHSHNATICNHGCRLNTRHDNPFSTEPQNCWSCQQQLFILPLEWFGGKGTKDLETLADTFGASDPIFGADVSGSLSWRVPNACSSCRNSVPSKYCHVFTGGIDEFLNLFLKPFKGQRFGYLIRSVFGLCRSGRYLCGMSFDSLLGKGGWLWGGPCRVWGGSRAKINAATRLDSPFVWMRKLQHSTGELLGATGPFEATGKGLCTF